MSTQTIAHAARRPRFRRASAPPPFQLTEDDVGIIRLLARHRFLRSTHIAALVGRSLDRCNDRLARLFHAGYLDRPRAQLDYYPNGSSPIVYALADRGARLLIERDGVEFANVEWSRKNRLAGRPFIDHQLEIMDFYVSLQCAARTRTDVQLIRPDQLVAAFPDQRVGRRNPFALRVSLPHRGLMFETSVVPDLAFGFRLANGAHRYFLVEIDRGTMPIVRSDAFKQTSFEEKMRGYLVAYAAKRHEMQFGWKNFRVLTVTTDGYRMRSMIEALRLLHVPHSLGAPLFYFASSDELATADPLGQIWHDGNGRDAHLS